MIPKSNFPIIDIVGRIPKKSDFLERNIENDKFRQTQEQRRALALRCSWLCRNLSFFNDPQCMSDFFGMRPYCLF
jgi:hypothetical protein